LEGLTEGEIAPGQVAPAPSILDRLKTREVLVSVAFFVVAFLLYWYLGPQETAYSYQVSQANNIIHGHLDLVPEHSKNLSVLEKVQYDGERFCLPPGDDQRLANIVEYADALAEGVPQEQARQLVVSDDCKTFMQHAVGPALIVIPGVAVWGVELNQALVSAVFGAMTAVIVYTIARHLTENEPTRLGLTVLMMFGTVFWWVAANGGVWFFAHTTAVFFLFGAIYFTVVRRSPLAAGALLGAAFMCRPTVLVAVLFFVFMFSDLWLKPRIEGEPFWRRIDLRPGIYFAAGIAPFMLLTMLLNFLRYDSPFESGYNYVESSHQVTWRHAYIDGSFDLSYLQRHPPVALGGMPVFREAAPYVLPSWFGMAIWVSTPAFIYAFFADIKQHRWLVISGAAAIGLSVLFMLSSAAAGLWDGGWADADAPLGAEFLPFWVMTLVAICAAIYYRDRLALACWSAIIPIGLVLFSFAFVGYAQFGYRYALDFMPFLWLLTAYSMGPRLAWHHWLLIAVGVLVSLWGVLWIYQFQPEAAFGVKEWVVF
jgi:hypothetical protein